MSYPRVIPRDLFNESKLLKCLGQLALIIHDRTPPGLAIEHQDPAEGFRIERDESSGALYCANLEIFAGGRLIGHRHPYNSKDPYPLLFVLGDEEAPMFNDDGTFSKEFLTLLKTLKK